ncbi:MAG: ADP-ribosylation factor-like protein [Candidatus Helarchaeota archaeon]
MNLPMGPSRFQIKCIFAGLDNGGKTSLLLTLEKKFLRILKIKPTKRISISDFSLLGLPVKIWDMGGQRKYRKEYLQKRHYFGGTHLLFYVIDIQNPERFEAALEYFEAILNNFVFLEMSPRIVVLLHKSDPEILDTPRFQKNSYTIRRHLSDIAGEGSFSVYQTSIYTPDKFHQIFIKELFQILPGGPVISQLLTQFMNDLKADAVQIIGENLLAIAEAHTGKKSLEICSICGRNLAQMARELKEIDWAIPTRIGIEFNGWIFFKYVPYNETCFYLIFFTHTNESLKLLTKFLPQFLDDLTAALDQVI